MIQNEVCAPRGDLNSVSVSVSLSQSVWDYIMTYDLTSFTTSRLLIDRETLRLCDFSKNYSAKMRNSQQVAKIFSYILIYRLQVVKVVYR
jgi:hypothetical protein